MKKLLLWIVIVGLLALPATACTSPASTPASSSTPSSSASPSSASPSSSSSPKPAGPTQVRFDEVWPPQIDPALGQDAASSDVYANVYDSLVFPNADGTLRSALAEKWDVSTDGLTYTFHLRQGVKFHNGDPLTADDVVFSAERLMKIGQGYAYLFLPIVDKVTADGAATVKITLKNAFGPFLNALVNLYVVNKKQVMANLVTPGDYGDMGDYGKKWLLTHDAGSGPYQVTEMKLEEHLVAEKFAGYWSPLDPKVPDSFTLIGTEEPVTIRTLLSNRQLEISDQWQSEENYQAMLKIDGVQLAQFLSGSLLSIQLHNRKAPTDDVHVRKALAYAMDYASLIAGVYQGSKQATGPSSALLPGHKADVFQYTTNLDKAQEEIKQSKYYGQLDQYPIDVCYAAEWTTADKIALLFQASAAKIGVKVNIAKQPWAKMVADVAKPETTAQANILTVSPHYGEAGSPLSRYLSSNCGTWEQCEWLQDPEIDQMINDALGTVDQTQRFQKYAAIQDKLVDICPSIWLVDVMEKHAYQAGYVDWGTANRTQAGGNAIPVQGYNLYLPDIKIDPAKMP